MKQRKHTKRNRQCSQQLNLGAQDGASDRAQVRDKAHIDT